ncbi:hypothetical protein [uncultured Muribaculum sp.]|uniref:hypothetical protein n=1 Tax=uncultured Muribaculum sp. TaxID=1918613 RepID=UPI0025B428B9|nr:hypothetical protein [uncultured Muribaculum sp.]
MAQQPRAAEKVDHCVNLSLHLLQDLGKVPQKIALLPHERKRRALVVPTHSA